MTRKLKLRAERTFQSHREGDVFLASETPEILAYVKSKLFSVLAIEQEPAPKPTKTKSGGKKKSAAKGKAAD
jgi:hypothetical protein